MDQAKRLQVSLLLLRLGVFIVILFWALDKIVQPEHAAQVFANFYFWEEIGATTLAIIGIIQIVIVLAFVAGLFRTWTYGLVLAMHAVSTLASYSSYLAPFDNLLFLAGWPMLAACITLFLLRDSDTLFSLDALRAKGR
jgi:putative oxidoreductase